MLDFWAPCKGHVAISCPWNMNSSDVYFFSWAKISPECSLEKLMLKLKLQYSGHLMPRANSLEKILEKVEGRRRRGQQRMRLLDSITNMMDRNLSNFRRQWCTGKPGMPQVMGLQRTGHDLVTEQRQQFSSFSLSALMNYQVTCQDSRISINLGPWLSQWNMRVHRK